MRIIKATIPMLESRTLVIGFQGENLRTQLRIDCAATFAEYPNATPALAVKPSSGETYPVFVERDGNEVVWDIVANNLVLKGDGELQLTFYKGDVIAKTVIGTIRVNRSLQIDGEMPDVVATWIENANRKLAEVDAQIVELEGMVDTATDAAERAEQSASTASTKAEQAAGSAATATAKATEATNAAGTATAKAAEAEQSALTATEKATAAAESERIATAKAGEATTAAGTATAKAEQATEAAQTATEKAGDASASATAAHASEINAAESADDALSAEVGANAAKRAAEGSATQAGASAQNAGIAAQIATQKATEATQSATNAAAYATSAATSAETASTKAGEAAQSAQAVTETAEQLADSLEQIEQNTQDIAELDERKANVDGYYPDMTVGNAEQLNSSKYVENSEPYTLRTSGGTSDIGNREYVDAVVGGTVAWNQLVPDADGGEESITITLESGKKYLARISGTDSMLLGSGQEITAVKGTDNVFDLTQMFGTAVADYVYGQGASFFRKWFPNAVYPYNAGELKHVEGLQSHDMVGFNLWDEEWEAGTYSTTDGSKVSVNDRIRNKNPIPVLPNTTYYIGSSVNATWNVPQYDTELNFINNRLATNSVFTTDANCHFINFSGATNYYGATYNHDICINLSHNGSRNGEYEPYEKHSYPFDSTVVLRGIPKVGTNGVYWDGDRYLPDGTIERRYGVVDLGTLNYLTNWGNSCYDVLGVISNANAIISKYSFVPNVNSQTMPDKAWTFASSRLFIKDSDYSTPAAFKAAMSGVLLVYELATPTTETAQPYHSTQWVSDWGTEEFVSTGLVPVGTETRYPANLRDKLQHLPDAASGNGSYLITQTDGQMVLTPFPAPPSTAGNYVLKATVTGGVATYTWEVAT